LSCANTEQTDASGTANGVVSGDGYVYAGNCAKGKGGYFASRNSSDCSFHKNSFTVVTTYKKPELRRTSPG
jgi:hypothetical protein